VTHAPQTFRKRPVVIRAMRFDGTEASAKRIVDWIGGEDRAGVGVRTPPDETLDLVVWISTMEGAITASPGDWVIRGIQGEFYPCKPDIFEATHERVGPQE
jgi:hypothetical protein